MSSFSQKYFPQKHFQAILFRRWTLVKRSVRSVVLAMVGTLIFSALAIILQWLMVLMMKAIKRPMDFTIYTEDPRDFIIVGQQSQATVQNAMTSLRTMFRDDVSSDVNFVFYDDTDTFNRDLYENISKAYFPVSAPFGLEFEQESGPMRITVLYNSSMDGTSSTSSTQLLYALSNLNRIFWKNQFGQDADITVSVMRMLRRLSQRIFGQLGPMLITCGLISIVPLLINQPIIDINGEVRQYMISCTLKIMPYWVATFLIDIAIWAIVTTVIWAVFNACFITAFHDNLLNTWYSLVFAGPSFILFTYCISFFFSSPDSASRQAFLILIVILLVPVIVQIVRDDSNPVWLDWIYSLFPHIGVQQLLGYMLTNMGEQKQQLDYYWRDSHAMAYLIMQWGDIIIYSVILIIIEKYRIGLQRKAAKRSFGDYHDFFKKVKSKHPVTPEVHEMEEEVHNNSDFAVRVVDCSRLFINTAGEPIPAVNCVSLGVKEGSLFGFLGANGAGKTTLIRMITGMLPTSDGYIEINGTNIENLQDTTVLSICPQFNTHLCSELTPREHFKLYSLLFQLNPKDTRDQTEKLMRILELEELGDKPIRELSGGDVRKLAIALSFLGPAKIILLDEPTASLDPVARHHVHEMILEFKGDKTFMLCTHLLSEAESLCDTISIMIKGTVYTIGSPQYLTAKFGTEYKIDVMLKDESEESGIKCDQYFARELPTAVLSIKRPKARIYSIPAADTTLPELFRKMQNGADDGDSGFSYYTCSSSSLERVFLEIVHMSENEDIEIVNHNDSSGEAKKKLEEQERAAHSHALSGTDKSDESVESIYEHDEEQCAP